MGTATRPQRQGQQMQTPEQRNVALVRRDELLTFVTRYAGEIEKLAPRDRFGNLLVNADNYVAALRLYFQENPKLLDCTPISIATGMLRIAQTGLILGVSCDLLPFKAHCQFSPRYTGLIELALASGTRKVDVGVVRDGDHFEFDKGTNTFLSHRPIAKSGAPITHGYAIAEIKQGSFSLEVMTAEQINAHRKKFSKQWWMEKGQIIPLEDIPWYGKKTPLRQLSNVLPKNPRLAAALTYEKQAEEEEIPEGTFEPVSAEITPAGRAALEEGSATAKPEAPTATQQEDWEFQDDRNLDDYPGRGR
jgi:phage RecT family recombinase